MAAQTLIQIGGQTVDASSVTLPSTGRSFRGAWVKNGDVIEVDMAVAKDIHIRSLIADAETKAEEAEKKQKFYGAKGDNAAAAAEAAKVNRFRGVPAGPAQTALNNAATPDALLAVTLDDFLP